MLPQKPLSVYDIKRQCWYKDEVMYCIKCTTCSTNMYYKTGSQAYADMLSSPLRRIGQLAAGRAA